MEDDYFQDEGFYEADIKRQYAELPGGGEGLTAEEHLKTVAEFRAKARPRLQADKAEKREEKKK